MYKSVYGPDSILQPNNYQLFLFSLHLPSWSCEFDGSLVSGDFFGPSGFWFVVACCVLCYCFAFYWDFTGALRFRVRLSGPFVTLIFVDRCHVSFIGIAFWAPTNACAPLSLAGWLNGGRGAVRRFLGSVVRYVESLGRSC